MVILYGKLDHKAIILQIDFDKKIVKCHFQFNPVWLEETSFYEFFKEKSINMSKVSYSSMMYGLITKLSRIKEDVQKWENLKQDESQRI